MANMPPIMFPTRSQITCPSGIQSMASLRQGCYTQVPRDLRLILHLLPLHHLHTRPQNQLPPLLLTVHRLRRHQQTLILRHLHPIVLLLQPHHQMPIRHLHRLTMPQLQHPLQTLTRPLHPQRHIPQLHLQPRIRPQLHQLHILLQALLHLPLPIHTRQEPQCQTLIRHHRPHIPHQAQLPTHTQHQVRHQTLTLVLKLPLLRPSSPQAPTPVLQDQAPAHTQVPLSLPRLTLALRTLCPHPSILLPHQSQWDPPITLNQSQVGLLTGRPQIQCPPAVLTVRSILANIRVQDPFLNQRPAALQSPPTVLPMHLLQAQFTQPLLQPLRPTRILLQLPNLMM